MRADHEMMDDCAEWATRKWPRCTGNCEQGRRPCQCEGGARVDTKQPMPAEACTEFGFERMGKLTSWERFLFRHKSGAETIFWLTVLLALFGLAGHWDMQAGL